MIILFQSLSTTLLPAHFWWVTIIRTYMFVIKSQIKSPNHSRSEAASFMWVLRKMTFLLVLQILLNLISVNCKPNPKGIHCSIIKLSRCQSHVVTNLSNRRLNQTTFLDTSICDPPRTQRTCLRRRQNREPRTDWSVTVISMRSDSVIWRSGSARQLSKEQWRHWGAGRRADRPVWHPPGGWHPKEKIVGKFTNNSGETRSGR